MLRQIRDDIKRMPVIGPALHNAYLRIAHREGETLTVTGGKLSGYRLKRFMRTTLRSYLDGTYEPEMQRAIADNLKPGMVFYDVGANGGFFSLLAASIVGPAGSVVAFEPHPLTVAQLSQQVKLNSLGNVRTVVSAVCDRIGNAQFDDEIYADMASVVEQEHAGRTITVRTTTLDHQVALGLPVPDMVKIDVEGAEIKVLLGALNLIREKRPRLLVELHSAALRTAYFSLVNSLNYSTLAVSNKAVLSV